MEKPCSFKLIAAGSFRVFAALCNASDTQDGWRRTIDGQRWIANEMTGWESVAIVAQARFVFERPTLSFVDAEDKPVRGQTTKRLDKQTQDRASLFPTLAVGSLAFCLCFSD